MSLLTLFVLLSGADPVAELVFPTDPQHNHSSCIVEFPHGGFFVCWYRGSGERKADDVRIMASRLYNGKSKWSEPYVLADTPGLPDCNPVMMVDGRKRLWLFWPTILDNNWESALLKVRRSSDFEAGGPPIWELNTIVHVKPADMAPHIDKCLAEIPAPLLAVESRFAKYVSELKRRANDKLYQRLGWMPRVHPIETASGKLLLPLYCDTYSLGLVATTDDDGASWKCGTPMTGLGAIQPALVAGRDGSLTAYLRENGPRKKIRTCRSTDDGMTWTPMQDTTLPNPGSSVDAVRLSNGDWVLIYNDGIKGRHKLAVALSRDDGKTWGAPKYLENWEPGVASGSYPSILQAKDGSIHATYSFKVEKQKGSAIKHVRFDPAWLSSSGR